MMVLSIAGCIARSAVNACASLNGVLASIMRAQTTSESAKADFMQIHTCSMEYVAFMTSLECQHASDRLFTCEHISGGNNSMASWKEHTAGPAT